MDEAAQAGDDVSPVLRRVRRGLLGLSLTGPLAARGIWGLESWPQALVSAAVALGLVALGARMAVHRLLGYRDSLPAQYRSECVFVGIGALAYALSFAGHPRLSLVGFVGLPLTALAYGWLDDAISTTRARDGLPTATDWLRGRRAWGHTVGEITDEGSHGVARTVATITTARDGKGRRRAREGATFTSTVILTLFTSASISFASGPAGAYLHGQRAQPHPAPSQIDTSPVPSPSPVTETMDSADRPSYDEVCGVGALQPGDSAPEWARSALWRLWLGADTGVGALLGGCVVPHEQVPGHPDVAFQAGYIGGSLRGVGVSLRAGPTTIYLGKAAPAVLELLRSGRVVAGRNGGVVHSLDSMRQLPSGRLYVPKA